MNLYLLVAGALSAVAALLHVGCILFGASWYRFFGAGERMARLAEQGSSKPAMITLVITLVLISWAVCAFSAAGLIPGVPFVKAALVVITAVYLVRGVGGLFLIANPIGRSPSFWLWSSSVCLLLGMLHLVGLTQLWPHL